MDPNQLEDADRRGFNPYAHPTVFGSGKDVGRVDPVKAQQHADAYGRTSLNPTEQATGPADSLPVEPEPGTVIGFTKRFRPDGPGYAYVAIRVKGKGWFATDGEQRAWADLVAFADGAALWVTREWTQLA